MIVLGQANPGFEPSNAVVTIYDSTYVDDVAVDTEVKVQDFNMLIPTAQDIGPTNVLEYYQPGEIAQYIARHGNPNPLKYGFGPNFIAAILDPERADAKVGVYTINLRGPSASMANVVVMMKYRIDKDVPYLDSDGNQYYKDADGQLTTTPGEGAEPIIRDVLHTKYVTGTIAECKKWTDLHNGMSALMSEEEDDEGYRTIPWFGVLYRGASEWANNVYFSLVPIRAEYDDNMYYRVRLFNGQTMTETEPTYSFDVEAGKKYGSSYYFETLFNEKFPQMRYLTAVNYQDMTDLIEKYLYTVDDYLDGAEEPSMEYSRVDVFNLNSFQIVVDEGSINPQLQAAFRLQSGTDGTETRDELFRMFFDGEILQDISSPLRYRINYIPDIGYDFNTKKAISGLVERRIRMTTATLMLGGQDSFNSAIIEHMGKWYETMPNIRQLAKVQSPMAVDPWTRRTMVFPGTYFDTVAMLDFFIKWGNYYQPFAGAEARWTGYIDDTMPYAPETTDYLQSLAKTRINIVMKDARDGAYLGDQLMNTQRVSDQTELNNAFLISNMLYDLVNLIHYNHFKFNEAEEVRQFNEAVNDCINSKYLRHSASMKAVVTRVGTVGRARFRNKISVTIDLKDISKYTDIDLYLVDE